MLQAAMNGHGLDGPHAADNRSLLSVLDPDMAEFIANSNKRQEIDRKAKEQREWESGICDLLGGALMLRLSEEMDELKETGAPSTRRVYAGDCKRFKQYCDQANMPFRPAAPEMVSSFLLEEFDAGASVHSIKRMVAAISFSHRNVTPRIPDPTDDIFVRSSIRRINKLAAGKASTEKEH